MTKAELVEKIQAEHGATLSRKKVADLIDSVFEEIGKSVKKEGRFSYPGFGTFSLKKRKGRTGRNPRSGEPIKIAPSKTVGFKPSPELKDSLGQPKE